MSLGRGCVPFVLPVYQGYPTETSSPQPCTHRQPVCESEGDRALQLFYWLPIKRRPADRAGLATNRIEFDREDSDFQFWGLFAEDRLPWGDHAEAYLFGVWENDAYDPSDSSVTPSGSPSVATSGSRTESRTRQGLRETS